MRDRNEAETRAELVDPKLASAGWGIDPHLVRREMPLTAGRLRAAGDRDPPRRADYGLCLARGFTVGVVEAKRESAPPGEGLSQALEYARMLGARFAFATNGHTIIERDVETGVQRELDAFPSPDELWARLREASGLTDETAAPLLTPTFPSAGRTLRYYQERAVCSVLDAIVRRRSRVLLTMATGTGKTEVAFQICWRLWESRWNVAREHRRPRILYLADRNILVDDPKDKTFAPFGNVLCKIESGKAPQGREMHFALYQSLVGDGSKPLFEKYPRDYFDLVIVDECHRGSARENSLWRTVLAYFNPAVQLGLTATPLTRDDDDDRDSRDYFGAPVYTYSLRQGINDGFLSPYRVFRFITDWDADGWRPTKEERDRFGRQIPDQQYTTEQFERAVALKARTETLAKSLTRYLDETGPDAKTIVFCVDQEHALLVRDELAKLNSDKLRRAPDWVCRVTGDEGDIGRAHLSRFQDPESASPVVLTSSQLLTTGVDAPDCRNVVLMRVVPSMIEFKQIIGRGTRLCEAYGKRFFNVVDYTGASNMFADPDFDDDPEAEVDIPLNLDGEPGIDDPYVPRHRERSATRARTDTADTGDADVAARDATGAPPPSNKYYVDGGVCTVVSEQRYDLDDGGALTSRVPIEVAAQSWVIQNLRDDVGLRAAWCVPEGRVNILQELTRRGATFESLTPTLEGLPEGVDMFDVLASVSFATPPLTRAQRAANTRSAATTLFESLTPEARELLEMILARYEAYGPSEFILPDVLKVPSLAARASVGEYAAMFGGVAAMRAAVEELQRFVYEVPPSR